MTLRIDEGANALDGWLSEWAEKRQTAQVSCGGEVGRVASDCPGERIPTVELAPSPAGIQEAYPGDPGPEPLPEPTADEMGHVGEDGGWIPDREEVL